MNILLYFLWRKFFHIHIAITKIMPAAKLKVELTYSHRQSLISSFHYQIYTIMTKHLNLKLINLRNGSMKTGTKFEFKFL